MIHFSFNDRIIECKPDTTVLNAARAVGIPIPTLCYHPALKSSGTCKLCAVEVTETGGRQTIMLSCLLKAKEGMIIRNDTQRVTEAIHKAVERLYALAPMSQRIQEIAADQGVDLPPAADGCILCRLCIRVCEDVVGPNVLHMVKINGRSRVEPVPGKCIGCGTCANICPTQVIRIVDQGDTRKVFIRDQLIGRTPLERCQGCGKYYASEKQVEWVEQRTGPHPHIKIPHHYCSTCAKLFSDRLRVVRKHPVNPPRAMREEF